MSQKVVSVSVYVSVCMHVSVCTHVIDATIN